MPVINFNGADKVILGVEADRVYLGNVLAWEAQEEIDGVLYYDSRSGKPFDYKNLAMNQNIVIVPKKEFPLDHLEKDLYGFIIDIVIADTSAGQSKGICFGYYGTSESTFDPNKEKNIVWSFTNLEFIHKNITNVRTADWIDKIYIVEE